MPSSQRQKGIVIKGVNKKTGRTYYVLAAERTGFIDVHIANRHYYYNAQKNVDPKKISIDKIIEDAETKEAKRNGIIVIRRK